MTHVASLLLVLLASTGLGDTAWLVAQALDGKAAAVRMLVARLTPVIRARVRRRLGSAGALGPEDGDDLVQQVWTTLLRDGGRQLRAYDPSRGLSLESFVGMVAEREVGNARQRLIAEKRGGGRTVADADAGLEAPSPADSPEDAALARDLAAALSRHLEANLPPKGLLVLRCLYTDGHPPETVASMLGVNLQVVYNWQHRIRTLARAFLTGSSIAT